MCHYFSFCFEIPPYPHTYYEDRWMILQTDFKIYVILTDLRDV